MYDFRQHSPYQSYTYAYPHKTAYRRLEPAPSLEHIWAHEPRDSLFLYLHIPFCEMRCGFCNLFTTVNPAESLESAYLKAIQRQAKQVRHALQDASFSHVALGGGTPTYLNASELAQLFEMIIDDYGVDVTRTPISVESSPATATQERLELLAHYQVNRVSIGVQSFIESEVRSVGRQQKNAEVTKALETIRKAGIPILNIDLIYGMPEQDAQRWHYSLQRCLDFAPEEIYLYPLYVRPLTGLDKIAAKRQWDDERLELYQRGRDFLLENGYKQVSMRMFRRENLPKVDNHANDAPMYCCQNDGMVGLGCGARSYTRALHYSSEYAVQARGVKAILQDYVQRSETDFATVRHGFQLDTEEQQRRFMLQSLLQAEGLARAFYQERFGRDVLVDYPRLHTLEAQKLAQITPEKIQLSPEGLAYSDAIGACFYSDKVKALTASYEQR